MKTIIIVLSFLLLPVFCTAQTKTLDDIFKTADDVIKVFEKAGEYYNEVQKSFGSLRMMNATGETCEFYLESSSLLGKDKQIILDPGEDDNYEILMPISTDAVQIAVLAKVYVRMSGKDGILFTGDDRVEVIETKSQNYYFYRGSSQKFQTAVLREKDGSFWIENF